jgi:hypothetical protein
VLVNPAMFCGCCDLCRRDLPQLCRNGALLGRDVDGCFAQLVAVDEACLHPLPDNLPAADAGLLQVLSTCVHAQSGLPAAESAVVVGLGVSGLLHLQLLAERGVSTLIGVTRSAAKRELALRLGAGVVAGPGEADDAVAETGMGVVENSPRGGLVDDGKGNQALACGVLVNIYEPHVDNPNQQRLQPEGYGQTSGMSLETATDRLVQELRYSNQKMRIIRNHEDIQVDGQPALSTYFSNDSPVGGRETDRLVTLQRPEGLLFLVFAAPERDFQGYESAFQQMLYSVRVQSGNSPSYSSSGNDQSYSGPGRMTWRGRVDAYVELTMQNNRVRSIEREGVPTVNEQVNFSSPLPRADVRVSVNKLNGRGEVSVIQQPNQSNNYTAIIKILDDKGGADDYEIEVNWR